MNTWKVKSFAFIQMYKFFKNNFICWHVVWSAGAEVSEYCAACIFWILKLEVAWLSEALVPIYQTTRHHIPENSNLQLRVWSYFIMKLNWRRNKKMSGKHAVGWPVSGHVVSRNRNRTLISEIYVRCFTVFPTSFEKRRSFK